MSLVQRELSKKMHLRSELDFPFIVNKLTHVIYTFTDKPSFGNNKYIFGLYRYFEGKPVLSAKKMGTWDKGQSIGYDLEREFHIEEGIEYCMKITIYIENNREIFDVIFIKI